MRRVLMAAAWLAIMAGPLWPTAGPGFAAAQDGAHGNDGAHGKPDGARTRLDAAYTATLLGLPIGHISWSVDLHGDRFSAVATGALSGLMRIFADGHGEVAAHGALFEGRPVASVFVLRIVAGKWSDTVRILFHGGKAQEFVAAQPKPDPAQVPLTAANRTGVVDPMTALLVHMPGTGDPIVPAACERTIAIFDGHTRYNLRLAFKRRDKVKTAVGYQGPVVVCAVKFFPVAGYDPKHFLITYLASRRDMEVWLAPFAGSRLMVPYRLSVPTPLGLGILQATKFEARSAGSSSARSNRAGAQAGADGALPNERRSR